MRKLFFKGNVAKRATVGIICKTTKKCHAIVTIKYKK